MKNFICSGNRMPIVAPSGGVVSGNAYLVGAAKLCIAFDSAAAGETVVVVTRGVFELPKAAGAISQGAKVYWDDTAKNITTTTTSNTLCGYAFTAAASGDTTIQINIFDN